MDQLISKLSSLVPVAWAQTTPSQTIAGRYLYPPCLRDVNQAQTAGGQCVLDTIYHYIGLLAAAVAIGAFIYLLYGATQYIGAFGDESKAAAAKKTLTGALIGAVLATLAWLVIRLVASLLNAPIATP